MLKMWGVLDSKRDQGFYPCLSQGQGPEKGVGGRPLALALLAGHGGEGDLRPLPLPNG